MEKPKSQSENEAISRPETKALQEWILWLKEKAQKVFERRHKEKEPKLLLDILYAPHATPEDRAEVREKFTHADIYIPEGFYWTQEVLDLLRDASKGSQTRDEITARLRGTPHDVPYMYELIDMMYGSGKEIAIIDVPEGHEMAGSYFSLMDVQLERGKSFKEAIDAIREGVRKQAEFHAKREEYMLSNIDSVIKERIHDNPNLQKKENVRALLSLGSYHTWLYHDLRRQKDDVSRTFKNLPLVFSYGTEADRRYRFHREIPDDLLAKVLLEVLSYHAFDDVVRAATQDSQKLALFFRKVVSHFTTAEIQAIYDASEKTTFERVIIEACGKKGIQLPETEADIDEFLKQT